MGPVKNGSGFFRGENSENFVSLIFVVSRLLKCHPPWLGGEEDFGSAPAISAFLGPILINFNY